MKKLLEIIDLHVVVGDKEILKGIDLEVNTGEVHALFGPNGSGKTTLISAIMGFGGYEITKGKIIFSGRNITDLPPYERARLGIGISFQKPPPVSGVKLKQLVELCAKENRSLIEEYANELNLKEHLDREVNVGFSGGEVKRSELLQLLVQSPQMVLLDEPESGVDLENIALIGKAINLLLGRKVEPKNGKPIKEVLKEKRKSAIVITHTGHILDYVEPDYGHVLLDGKIVCSGNPREILHTIKEHGYNECYRCFTKEGQQ
jgi:Fe-S cluster assembly ATP-binding protein